MLPSAKTAVAVACATLAIVALAVVGLGYALFHRSPDVPAVALDRWHGTGTIRGTVCDEAGAPVAGVSVRATLDFLTSTDGVSRDEESTPETARGAERGAVTGSDGTYAFTDLPAMRAFVDATRPGWRIERSEPSSDAFVRPDAVVNFAARQVVLVKVRVLRPDGAPALNANVEIKALVGANVDLAWSATAPDVELSRGLYEIRATDGDHDDSPSDVVVTAVDPSRGADTVELRLRENTSDVPHVVVRIVDPAGQTVVPDEVTYAMEGADWSSHGPADSWRRSDGALRVEFPSPRGEATTRVLIVRTAAFGRRVVELPALRCAPIDVRLAAPAFVDVVAEGGPAAAPHTPLVAELEDPRWRGATFDARPAAPAPLDAVGRARLGPLTPGAYELTLSDGGYPRRVLAKRSVDVASGDNRVGLPVGESCCVLTVEAGATRKFWFVHVRRSDDDKDAALVAQAQTDAAGHATFEWLRAGAYDVEIEGETRRVEVGAKTTLRW
jgi:protocatechuate 3,4-dioxygenase beta subunit